MSDTNQADSGAEYETAWKEGADEQSQPDEGRAAPSDQKGDDNGGADADAGQLPAADAQTTDADLPPAGDENSDDLWTNADPKLKAAFEAEQAKAARAENALRSNEGRFSRAERELNEFRLRDKQQREQQPQAGNDTGKQPVDIGAVLTKVREEYPEIGGLMAEAVEGLQAKVDSLEKAGASQAEIQTARQDLETQEFLGRQVQHLTEKHPDWETIATKSVEYAEWAKRQPAFVQDLMSRNGTHIVDGEAAVEVMDRFKRDTQTPADPKEQQRRESQLEGSRHIPPKAPVLEPSGGGSGDYLTEFNRARDEERRQARK